MADGRAWGMIDKGESLAFVRPKEGALVGMSMLEAVKGSKNAKEAHECIDAVLDAYSQFGQAYEIPCGPTISLLVPVPKGYPNISKKVTASLMELEQAISAN